MTQNMERLGAALADRYRILRPLGAGGMATVYLAQDLKHERQVALKVLKPELAAVLGAERFVVEIKTTAQMSHPHILPLFDSGAADGFLYYVMPYVEGPTLRDRLNRETQLGVEDALRIATEVADALEYAHSRGIIHRDIKPENILLQGGRAMVADFGIALAVSAAAGGRMTETGLSLGTPHYMSPEQATADKEITGRSDVYSLGSVLYEMLTGEPPHMGTSAQQIIMKIIADNPRPVTALRKSVPEHVSAAVGKALEKLPADRFATAAEFSRALHTPVRVQRTGGASLPPAAAERRWRTAAMAAATVAIVAIAAPWIAPRGVSGDGGERVEFALRLPPGPSSQPVVEISPDGRDILFSLADSNGVTRLVRRNIARAEMTVVPGTDDARNATYSPDGRWIAFERDGRLFRIPTEGGSATIIADSTTSGMHWARDGMVYYTYSSVGLARVPENGGPAEILTRVDTGRSEFNHWSPQLLPGGRAVIFTSFSTPFSATRIEAVDLKTRERTAILDGAIFARYVRTGHLLFAREGAVFAAPFDVKRVRVTGPAVPVVEDLAWIVTDAVAGYAVSETGTLVHFKASEWTRRHNVVFGDRSGRLTPALDSAGFWAEPRLSPDGRWLALTRTSPGYQLWFYDRVRRVLSQRTQSDGVSFNAHWMPDSRGVVFSGETPVYDLFRMSVLGGQPELVLRSRYDKLASGLTPDGHHVLFHETDGADRILSVPLAGGTPQALAPSTATQRNATVSPNGRWLAYEQRGSSMETHVFVQPLTGGGGGVQASSAGGSQPRWTKGGRELVFRRGPAVYAVSVDPQSGELGSPQLLFRYPDAGRLGGYRTMGYDVTPDGERFVLIIPEERPEAMPVRVVLNWFDELRVRTAGR